MSTPKPIPTPPRTFQAAQLAVLAALAAASPALRAAAQTDGSAGRLQGLSGRFTVPQSLGTLSGQNLFHSFQSFSVAPGESATFTTTSPLKNVIARVTGGTPSTIDGPLKLNAAGGGKPSFFFVNPAGVTVGAGGSVDVPGTLHLSTAHYLKFADGSVYRSDAGAGSSFSAADPAAFGFLGPRTGTVRLQSAYGTIFLDGQSVSITAGDIEVDNANLIGGGGGDLRLAAVGATAVEVGLAGPLPALSGRVSILNGALVGTIDPGPTAPGSVAVSAGDVLISSTASGSPGGIIADTNGSSAGGTIRVDTTGALVLQDGGNIASTAVQSGRAGAVDIHVGGTLTIGANSGIQSISTASGDAGKVNVVVQGPAVLDGGGSASAAIGSETNAPGRAADVSFVSQSGLTLVRGGKITASSYGPGQAGRVSVDAAAITIDNQATPGGTGIASQATSAGNAGSVDITTTGMLTVKGGGTVSSSSYGSGQGGVITVRAGSILLDGQVAFPGTGIVSETSGNGHAGSIAVSAVDDITIRDGARISSSSFGAGNAGSVRVDGNNLRVEDAHPGVNATGILSISLLGGNAGTVDVAMRGLLSIDDGLISTSTVSSGQGGAVTVGARNIRIRSGDTGGAGLTSNASGTGDAGSVSVVALQDISMVNGGTIASSTFGPGNAGTVSVRSASLQLDSAGSVFDSSIASETHGSGRAGAIDVAVSDALSVVNQSTITSSTYGDGAAGQVKVRAASITLDKQAGTRRTGIGSVAYSGNGDGGSVDVAATGLLSLLNGAEISANTSTAGAAGSVQVRADRIALASGASINSGATTGSSGRTGNVAVAAGTAIALADSSISIANDATVASPETIGAGSLSLTAPRIDLARSQITASAAGNIAASGIVIDRPGLLSVREGSAINTTAVTGRGGNIEVRGAGTLLLDHSQLTTSITGTSNGDGGPIAVDSRVIVLNSGFVQANTAVAKARGGDVSINAGGAGVLIASGLQLITGGLPVGDGGVAAGGGAVSGPNVIQAARPDGVNGDLGIFSPQVDLSAGLATLGTPRLDFGLLGADLCRIGDGSSLTPVGRGAPRPSFAERLRPAP